jgi:hypothetical protein
MVVENLKGPVLLYLFVKGIDLRHLRSAFGRQRISSQGAPPPKRLQSHEVAAWTCALVQTLYGEYGGFVGSERPGERGFRLDSHSAKERDEQMVKTTAALSELCAAAVDNAIYLEVPHESTPESCKPVDVKISESSLLAMPCNCLCKLRMS